MSMVKVTESVSPVTDVVDDAVGVPKRHWFVAIVNHNSEKRTSEKLDKMGIVNYLPTQTEIRVWKNGRKSKIDRVVIPSTIFIYSTEEKRKELVNLSFILRFMTDKASSVANSSARQLAIIPDSQIERLKFMLGQSDAPVEITSKPFKTGDKVRVIRGKLKGLEGEVLNLDNVKSELVVALNFMGCAKLSIDTMDLEIIEKDISH